MNFLIPDKEPKMTETEIMKALECCGKGVFGCTACPLFDYGDDAESCKRYIMSKSLALINRKNAENERLKKLLDAECDTCACGLLEQRDKARAEIERLENIASEMTFENKHLRTQIDKIKAEAIKEFAERVKETKFKHGNEYVIYADNLDQIAKEMGVE